MQSSQNDLDDPNRLATIGDVQRIVDAAIEKAFVRMQVYMAEVLSKVLQMVANQFEEQNVVIASIESRMATRADMIRIENKLDATIEKVDCMSVEFRAFQAKLAAIVSGKIKPSDA